MDLEEIFLISTLLLIIIFLIRASRRKIRRAGKRGTTNCVKNVQKVWLLVVGSGRRRSKGKQRRVSSREARRRARQKKRDQKRLTRTAVPMDQDVDNDEPTNPIKVPGPSLEEMAALTSESSLASLQSDESLDDDEDSEIYESHESDESDDHEDEEIGVEKSWFGITIWTRVYNSMAYDWVHGIDNRKLPLSGGYVLPSSTPGGIPVLPRRTEKNTSRLETRKRVWRGLYDVGWVWAVMAMIIITILVAWSATTSWMTIWRTVKKIRRRDSAAPIQETTRLMKRLFDEEIQSLSGSTSATTSAGIASSWMESDDVSVVKPLIPGITTPLSHLFPLLFALFVCQVIHETGHLVAAAIEGIKPLRVGVSFWWGLVSAGVAFGGDVDRSGIRPRLRISSSGPFHNFLTYLLLLLVAVTGVLNLPYRDYTEHGRIILSFSPNTPVQDHMPRSAIIQYVDDIYVGGKEEIWEDYMTSSRVGKGPGEQRGWCVDRKRYEASTKTPCHVDAPVAFEAYPFSSAPLGHSGNDADTHCLTPYPLLTTRTWPCPCIQASQVCVQPHPSESITRIQWLLPGEEDLPERARDERSRVMLWKGDRKEFLHGVKTGRFGPRGGVTGHWLLGMLEIMFGYISTLSLTLALLNLLPLPKLDGGHVLTALLDWIYPGTNEPIEDLEDGAGEQFYGFGEHSLSPRRGQLYEGAQEVSTFTATVENKRRRHLIERSISWGCGAIVVSGLGGMVMGMVVEHFGLK